MEQRKRYAQIADSREKAIAMHLRHQPLGGIVYLDEFYIAWPDVDPRDIRKGIHRQVQRLLDEGICWVPRGKQAIQRVGPDSVLAYIGKHGSDDFYEPPRRPRPCKSFPGTPGKFAELSRRVLRGEELFLSEDASAYDFRHAAGSEDRLEDEDGGILPSFPNCPPSAASEPVSATLPGIGDLVVFTPLRDGVETMTFVKVFELARFILDLAGSLEELDIAHLRDTVKRIIKIIEWVAKLTPTSADDAFITHLGAVVENDEAWETFSAILLRVIDWIDGGEDERELDNLSRELHAVASRTGGQGPVFALLQAAA